MSAEIVAIRDGAPSLADVVGMLRQLADNIESGEHGSVESLAVIMPVEGDYPRVFAFGDVEGANEPVLQLELAKMWLLTNLVQRS